MYCHAFDRIFKASESGVDKRALIMAKYLRKRVSGYFADLRRNIKQTEVEHWKREFQRSIKGTSVIKAFELRLRKYRSFNLRQWRQKAKNKTKKINSCNKLVKVIREVLS